MKRIRNFVKNTFKDVPKEQRQDIISTVTEQLIEKVEDLVDDGLTLDQAIDKTVIEFGSAEDYLNPVDSELNIIQRIANSKTIKQYRNDLLFSLFGAIIIIGMLVFTNLYYTGQLIWFVLPALAVLWWPLAVLYHYLNKKERLDNDDE
jgi:hypothetical protein